MRFKNQMLLKGVRNKFFLNSANGSNAKQPTPSNYSDVSDSDTTLHNKKRFSTISDYD